MILIIDKKKEDAIRLSDMFFYMGIPSFAAGVGEGLVENSPIYKAVIVLSPENFYDPHEFVMSLHSKNREAPIFAISENERFEKDNPNLFEKTFNAEPYASRIYEKIKEYTSAHSLPSPGIYKAQGIDGSVTLEHPTYHSIPIPFTKTESMILRTLISSHPTAFSSKSILKYAFKSTRAPDLASIRTHISLMNKKARASTGKNIITLSLGEGYRLIESDSESASSNIR